MPNHSPLYALAGLLFAAIAHAQPSLHSLPDSIAAPGTPTLIPRTGGGGATVFGEGVVSDWQGNVYCGEMDNSDRTMQLKVGQDTAHSWRKANDDPNGMWLDSQNRILICQQRAIVRVKAGATFDNQNDTVYKYTGQDFNDITGDSRDNLYFTNFNGNTVYFRNATTGVTIPLLSNQPKPNGIEWDEGRKVLYVNEYGANKVAAYDVGADFSLSNRRDFVTNITSPDGICLDSLGNVYVVAGGQGVQVYAPAPADKTKLGAKLGEIPLPNQSLTNLDFGGADFKTLYMVTNKGLYKLPMKVRGYKKGQSVVSLAKLRPYSAQTLSLSPIFRLDGRSLSDLRRETTISAPGIYLLRR